MIGVPFADMLFGLFTALLPAIYFPFIEEKVRIISVKTPLDVFYPLSIG
jgi:hypothetical protein